MDDIQKLKGRGCYRLNDTLLDGLASPWHVWILKHIAIAIHITTIATAKIYCIVRKFRGLKFQYVSL